MSSLTNKIIGNIKKLSTDFNINNYVNSNNVVSIDTSNNRIGINIKDPSYALHVYSESPNIELQDNTIKSSNIIIENLANIHAVSCQDISASSGFITNISFDTITHSAEINTNTLNTNSISDFSNTGKIIFNELSGTTINVDTINVDTIDVANLNAENIDATDLDKFQLTDLSTTNIDVSNIANITTLNIANQLKYDELFDFSNNTCTFYKINIIGSSNECIFNELSGISINVSDANFSNIKLDNETILENSSEDSNIIFGKDISDKLVIISNEISNNTLSSSTINSNIINVNTSLNILSNSQIDSSDSKLIIPLNKNDNISNEINGSITYDQCNNSLAIYNNSIWQIFKPTNEFASITNENNTISNNYILIAFENSNNLITGCEISNNNSIILIDPSANYEVHANINLILSNTDNNDVEIATYTFRLDDIYNNNYTETTNNIIAFGNSINYANSSISYIGPFKTANSNNINGFKFYLEPQNNTGDISINNFNAIIKKLT